MKTTPRLLRQRALPWVAAATLVFGLTGCGGPDNKDDNSAPTQDSEVTTEESVETEGNSGSTGNDGGASLPEGFPEGVPLPEYDKISSSGQLSETTWRLLLVVDPDDDEIIDTYAALLEDEGFEVQTSGSIISANSPTLSIEAVVRAPSITLQVMTRQE